MALQIEWTNTAEQDLNEVLEYWNERNGSKLFSVKLYELIKHNIGILARFPESGKPTNKAFIRVKIVKQYFVFYTYNDSTLTIMGLCDMRRDPEYIEKKFD